MEAMELYEFAKLVDVIAVFTLIYGLGLGALVNCIIELVHWHTEKVKKHRELKKAAEEETTEE